MGSRDGSGTHPETLEHFTILTVAVDDWKASHVTGTGASTLAAQQPGTAQAETAQPEPEPLLATGALDGQAAPALADLLAGKPVPPEDSKPDPDAPLRIIESATRDISPDAAVQPGSIYPPTGPVPKRANRRKPHATLHP